MPEKKYPTEITIKFNQSNSASAKEFVDLRDVHTALWKLKDSIEKCRLPDSTISGEFNGESHEFQKIKNRCDEIVKDQIKEVEKQLNSVILGEFRSQFL